MFIKDIERDIIIRFLKNCRTIFCRKKINSFLKKEWNEIIPFFNLDGDAFQSF